MSRYLWFSDLHGLPKAELLFKFAEEQRPDACFDLGDHGSLFTDDKLGGKVVEECGRRLSNYHLIWGNHDDLSLIEQLPYWLHDGLNVFEGLRIFAMNGIFGTRPKEKPWHKTVASMVKLMLDVGQVDLLLSHEQPFGLDYYTQSGKLKFHEDREWHKTFAYAVKEHLNPTVWLYGHSRSNVAERVIPELGLRTIGLDGRFVIVNDKFNIEAVEEVAHVAF
jgi:predicted phosphodiesterase